jgi:hypothetical protein
LVPIDHFGAQLMEDVRRDVVGGAVGAVDDDLQAAQVEFVREGALAKFDVAALGVAQARSAAQLFRRHAAHRLVDRFFDFEFDGVRQLGAVPEKNLMPLSWKGLCEAEITTPACRRSARVR